LVQLSLRLARDPRLTPVARPEAGCVEAASPERRDPATRVKAGEAGGAGKASAACCGAPEGGPRALLLARWFRLTRETLPAMAAAQSWPLRHDHCFMRVCLDAALGGRWDRHLPRPAHRHMDDATLARAVGIAEGIVADPASLPMLDRASRVARRALGPERLALRAGP